MCQAASGDMYTLVFASIPLNAGPQLIPGPTPASGCLLKIPLPLDQSGAVTPSTEPPTVAYVIQRFGVLLAVNDTAHRLWPFLPVADGMNTNNILWYYYCRATHKMFCGPGSGVSVLEQRGSHEIAL